MATVLRLYYGDLLVGRITDAFASDDTWFGICELVLNRGSGPREDRVLQFIQFSEEWHARLKASPLNPPDAFEFRQFSELTATGVWNVRPDNGDVASEIDAPVFPGGGEVTWRLADRSE
jgi:hypothetical protein